ncbi:polyphosphate polymerase domain-containing protein [bacterium]|nr:polyphosphate polymerase domain-containing protein [bacterium]
MRLEKLLPFLPSLPAQIWEPSPSTGEAYCQPEDDPRSPRTVPDPDVPEEFKRYELKFWTDRRTMGGFLDYLLHFMDYDPHSGPDHTYRIISLYMESRDLMTYGEKYNGDLERRKYRVRFYDDDPSTVFFEVKKKYNAFIRKARTGIALDPADFRQVEDLLLRDESPVNKEFLYGYRACQLLPMIWIAYRRVALVGRHNPGLRVTFDDELQACSANGFEPMHHRVRPLNLSRWRCPVILEIKSDHHYPLWMDVAMKDLNLRQESISKYGMAMARHYFHETRETWIH